MIYVLLGKTCSGKTTLLKHLTEKFNKKKSVAVTTRPIRNGEVDGVDYHFLDDSEFEKLSHSKKLLCIRNYHTKDGEWHYALDKESLNNHSEKSVYVILDPKGYAELKQEYKEHVVGIYLYASNETLRERGQAREDDPEEFERRLKSDDQEFKRIEQIVDHVIIPYEFEKMSRDLSEYFL